jgi:hypothetical protein
VKAATATVADAVSRQILVEAYILVRKDSEAIQALQHLMVMERKG